MPGTLASALTCIVYFSIQSRVPVWGLWAVWIIFSLAGVVAANRCEKEIMTKDPSFIVVDEFSGQWLALMGFPHTIPGVLAAFILFRLLDVFKPLGIRKVENIPYGIGTMFDDILAGCFVLAMGMLVRRLI